MQSQTAAATSTTVVSGRMKANRVGKTGRPPAWPACCSAAKGRGPNAKKSLVARNIENKINKRCLLIRLRDVYD